MPATETNYLPICKHMTLPFKHPIAHPLDMADLRLTDAKKRLEVRLNTIGDRMDALRDAAQEIDPKGFTPTARSERLWDIHDRAHESFLSVQDRLDMVKRALVLISDTVTESFKHRNKTIKARKARA